MGDARRGGLRLFLGIEELLYFSSKFVPSHDTVRSSVRRVGGYATLLLG